MLTEKVFEKKIKDSVIRGLNWLLKSPIYLRDSDVKGGLRSKYDLLTNEYEVWKGGETEILSTSGVIQSILFAKKVLDVRNFDKELEMSVNHICSLFDKKRMILRSGYGSDWVYPFWSAQSAYSLYLYAENGGNGKAIDIAKRTVSWLISIQNKDGSIPRAQILRDRISAHPTSSWNSIAIRTFLKSKHCTVKGSLEGAFRLAKWLKEHQLSDGSFYYSYGSYRNTWRNIRDIRKNKLRSIPRVLSKHTLWKHPTSQAVSLYGLLLLHETFNKAWLVPLIEKLYSWIATHLSERNLMYEKYYLRGTSIQEDVYPTAVFLQCNLILYKKKGEEKYLKMAKEIGKSILSTQIQSNDIRTDGAFPGVPLHPTEGNKPYTWDTSQALVGLIELYEVISKEIKTL